MKIDLKNSSSRNYAYAKAIQIVYNTGLWDWGGNYTKEQGHASLYIQTL
jgi:hypothetical protein